MLDTRREVRAPITISGRLAALAGAVSFVLILISAILRSSTPSATDSARTIFSYLALHHGQLQLGAVLAALAMSTALVWGAGLYRALTKADGGASDLAVAAFGGGVLTAASMLTLALIEGTMATGFHDLGPAAARIFWTMFLLRSTGAVLVGLLVVIGATAAVCLRAHLFPRWFAVASIVLALASLIGAFTIGYAAVGIQVVAGLAIIFDGVWIFMVSVYLWRDPVLTAP